MQEEYTDEFIAGETKRLSQYCDCNFALIGESCFIVIPEVEKFDEDGVEQANNIVEDERYDILSQSPNFDGNTASDGRVLVIMGNRTVVIGDQVDEGSESVPLPAYLKAREKLLECVERGEIIAFYDSSEEKYIVPER